MKLKPVYQIALILMICLAQVHPTSFAESVANYRPLNEVVINGEVIFNDSVLQKVLESNPLFARYASAKDYLSQISSLDLSGSDTIITDISALQLCSNLEEISLNCVALKNLDPISKCGKLKKIILEDVGSLTLEPLTRIKSLNMLTIEGAISDLTPVASMKQLTTFYGIGLEGTNLSPLASTPKLTTFLLDDSGSTTKCDISPISQAHNLSTLGASCADVQQFAAVIQAHTKTLKYLLVSNMAVSSNLNNAIGACSKLTDLHLENLANVDLAAVCKATSIAALVIQGLEDGCDFSALSSLKKLNSLAITNVKGASFKGIEFMPKLMTLSISNVEADDLSFIGRAPSLERATFAYIKGVTFDSAENLPKLKELSIDYVEVSDLSFIAQAPKLSMLQITGVRPINYSFLNALKCGSSLKSLSLGGANIDDPSFLNNLAKLEELFLLDTGISDLTPIALLPKLQRLVLYGNPITSYQPLMELKKLTEIQIRHTLYNLIIADLQENYPKAMVEQLSGTDVIDPLYEAAIFFGDENPQKRENRSDTEKIASEAYFTELKNQKVLALLKTMVTLTSNEVDVYPASYALPDEYSDSDYMITSVHTPEKAIVFPDEIDGHAIVLLYNVYFQNSIGTVGIPASIKDVRGGFRAGASNEPAWYTVAPTNQNFASVDGCVYSKDMSTLVACPPALSDFTIPNGVTTVRLGAFWSSNQTVTVPESVKTIESSDPSDLYDSSETRVKSFIVDEANPYFSTKDGSLTNKERNTLLLAGYTMGDNQFGCLVIPDGIQCIASGAFRYYWTSLRLAKIPASLTMIDKDSHFFDACHTIDKYEVDEGNPAYTTLKGNLVSKDQKTLIDIVLSAEGNVPEGIEIIPSDIFSNCDRLVLPASVKSIDFKGMNVKDMIIDDNNTAYVEYDGFITSVDRKTLYYVTDKAIIDGTIKIPDGMEEIAAGALDRQFDNYYDANSITVHVTNSIKHVADGALGHWNVQYE